MVDLQKIFDRIKETKAEQKVLRESYKNALANSIAYQNILKEYDLIKQKKKEIEERTQVELKSDFNKLDKLRLELASDQEMLSDIAMRDLMNGKRVEAVDEYGNKYEPEFVVRFKKV